MTADIVKLAALYADEDRARAILESIRWPNGAVACPHCGDMGPYRLTPGSGSSTRKGLWKCRACRKQFTVTVGTIFEDSHIKIGKWLMAFHLMVASKKGMSAHQLHRMLGITYRSAWFMAHRIRYAMQQPPLVDKLKGITGIVEADETYVGGKVRNFKKGQRGRGRGTDNKVPVVSLVERRGRVRSFPMKRITADMLKHVLTKHIHADARLMTDSYAAYKQVGKAFAAHATVDHGREEYVRGDAHTNTVEGYFSLLKRGVYGTFHHVSHKHLWRYLSEFDFRYNERRATDNERTLIALRQTEGKRLTYRPMVKAKDVGLI
jgi:transposase-like protein